MASIDIARKSKKYPACNMKLKYSSLALKRISGIIHEPFTNAFIPKQNQLHKERVPHFASRFRISLAGRKTILVLDIVARLYRIFRSQFIPVLLLRIPLCQRKFHAEGKAFRKFPLACCSTKVCLFNLQMADVAPAIMITP